MSRTSFIGTFTIAILFTITFSCSRNSIHDMVRTAMNHPVKMPTELLDTFANFKIVRYVKPTSCTSCQLELGLWRVYRKKLQRKFGNNVAINFIIETDNISEVQRLLSMYKFLSNSYIDSLGTFIKDNAHITDIGDDVVMLIDNHNNIKLLGNPCKDDDIAYLIDCMLSDSPNQSK